MFDNYDSNQHSLIAIIIRMQSTQFVHCHKPTGEYSNSNYHPIIEIIQIQIIRLLKPSGYAHNLIFFIKMLCYEK